MSRIVSCTLWDDLECAGGVRLGDLTVLRGTASRHLDSSDTCTMTIVHDTRVPVTVRDVVRLEDAQGTVTEYRVQSVGRTTTTTQRTVKAVSPLLDLATAGLVRQAFGGITYFEIGGTYTPAEFIDTFVLTNLAADGITWIAAGTIDPTGPQTITSGNDGSTRLEFLRALEVLTGTELRFRRNGSTGYLIDLTDVGAGATPLHVAHGKNLVEAQLTNDDAEMATAVTVFGTSTGGFDWNASIGENLWTLGTIPGSAPYWIPLTDPNGGDAPIAFDDQCVGYEVLLNDGTTLAITDARASDSSVLVSATTGLVAGERVQIVADSSATRLTELSTPNTPRIHRLENRNLGGTHGANSTLRGEANLVQNGTFASWASDDLPTGFGTTNGRRYPRATPATLTMTVAANAADLTVVSISGGTANARTFLHDYWVVSGSISTTIRQTAAVNLDGSGAGTFGFETLGGSTALALVAGDTLTLSSTTQLRPSSFPNDGDNNDIIRLDSTGSGVTTGSWTVKYLAGLPTVNAAAWVTEVNKSGGDILAVNCMTLFALDMSGPTPIATATAASDLLDGVTRSDVLNASVAIAADTTIAVNVDPIGVPSCGSYCRAIMLWLSVDAAEVPPPIDGSWANKLWQRANRALSVRAITVNQLQVSLRDLSAAAGYSITREQLVLGGDVVLDDLGLTVRLIGMTVPIVGDLSDVQVLLDSRPTRLLEFLAGRL